MKMWAEQSIRKKLMSVLLFTSSCALILALLGFAASDWFSTRTVMVEHLRSSAGIVGNNLVSALAFQDTQSANKTLASLKNERDIVAAVIFDKAGNIFTSYLPNEQDIPNILPGESAGMRDGLLFVQLPIELDGEIIGHILLVSKMGDWHQQQFRRITTTIFLFIVALLISVFISSRVQKVVTGPILKLAAITQRITETRDYTLRANKLSSDEIGNLVDNFNEMLQEIQERDNELQRIRLQLEEKVDERTAELQLLANKFEHQACHDVLTGLANRATFDHQLKAAISQSERYSHKLAVFFLDLDRFKIINDTLGHAVGDQLLIQLSERLSSSLRSCDTLARLGGDEFAVLLLEVQPSDVVDVATKLVNTVNEPLNVSGFTLHLTTSIGISVFPDDGQNAETILKNADTAMYRSKDMGRNQFTFYAPEMNEHAERRLVIENKLRKAAAEGNFQLHYQPKWDVETLQVTGVEALIRWFDPDEGAISPSEFIPLAEESGLIGMIDQWVMETACTEILSLHNEGLPKITLSVNFSPSHFIRHDVQDEIETILTKTGFPGHLLEFEITESLISSEAVDVYKKLRDIRELGIEISIDDFGKAYSSLSRLKQLPLNTLKIDRSFIHDLGESPDEEVIVKTIISMAHNLNLKVVAEGVETDQQYQFIKQHHCDTVQGYLFGKPVPIEEIARMLRYGKDQSSIV